MKKVFFIKFGGSLITNKERQDKLNLSVLKSLVKQISITLKKRKDIALIIGNGAGSFGHAQAQKYQTQRGLIKKNSLEGLAKVAYSARELNQLVVNEFLKVGLPAVSVSPLSIIMSKNDKPQTIFTDPIENLLRISAIPVVYGDVILDQKTGCTIFSTEKIFSALISKLKNKYKIEKIIFIGKTDGVLDKSGKTIEKITPESFGEYESAIGQARGFDVTGGMKHKVKEGLFLAKKGVNSIIVNGLRKKSLIKLFLEKGLSTTTSITIE